MERTEPFGLVRYSLTIVWYAQHGHAPTDVAAHRTRAPWYQTKTTPLAADMLARPRVLIAAQYQQGQAIAPTLPEILQVQAARAAAGAEVRKSIACARHHYWSIVSQPRDRGLVSDG